MDCKDRILSNNYYDIITDFPINLQAYEYLDLCYANIDSIISYTSAGKALGMPITISLTTKACQSCTV